MENFLILGVWDGKLAVIVMLKSSNLNFIYPDKNYNSTVTCALPT